jgi:DNA-binding response OmpR family regulator
MRDKSGRPLVFVVDDETTIAETVALILCGDGFDATAFTDPLAALKAARTEGPNLLLSDVIMPGLNGFELSTGIVSDCPQCKVLLFSGNPYALEGYATTPAQRSLEVLTKPVAPGDLLAAIRSKLYV